MRINNLSPRCTLMTAVWRSNFVPTIGCKWTACVCRCSLVFHFFFRWMRNAIASSWEFGSKFSPHANGVHRRLRSKFVTTIVYRKRIRASMGNSCDPATSINFIFVLFLSGCCRAPIDWYGCAQLLSVARVHKYTDTQIYYANTRCSAMGDFSFSSCSFPVLFLVLVLVSFGFRLVDSVFRLWCCASWAPFIVKRCFIHNLFVAPCSHRSSFIPHSSIQRQQQRMDCTEVSQIV